MGESMSEKPSWLAVIVLAAGRASRFGKPKQLARFHGKTLLGLTVDLAQELSDQVLLVTGAYSDQVNQAFKTYSLKRIYNPYWMEGMGSSIVTGVNSLDEETKAVLIMLADQPLTTKSHLINLVSTWSKHKTWAAATYYDSTFGVPAVFDERAFDELGMLSGDIGARQILRQHREQVHGVEPDFALIDVDTEEQLRAAESKYRPGA